MKRHFAGAGISHRRPAWPVQHGDKCTASAGKNVARQKPRHHSLRFIAHGNTAEYSRADTWTNILTPKAVCDVPPDVMELRTWQNYERSCAGMFTLYDLFI